MSTDHAAARDGRDQRDDEDRIVDPVQDDLMSFKMCEYLCPFDGRYESLEERPPPTTQVCPACGETSELVISGPPGFGQFVTVERGQLAKPPGPNFLDTSGYGLRKQSYREWKDARDKLQREQRWKELKRKL